jgi:hypothetical protein
LAIRRFPRERSDESPLPTEASRRRRKPRSLLTDCTRRVAVDGNSSLENKEDEMIQPL